MNSVNSFFDSKDLYFRGLLFSEVKIPGRILSKVFSTEDKATQAFGNSILNLISSLSCNSSIRFYTQRLVAADILVNSLIDLVHKKKVDNSVKNLTKALIYIISIASGHQALGEAYCCLERIAAYSCLIKKGNTTSKNISLITNTAYDLTYLLLLISPQARFSISTLKMLLSLSFLLFNAKGSWDIGNQAFTSIQEEKSFLVLSTKVLNLLAILVNCYQDGVWLQSSASELGFRK